MDNSRKRPETNEIHLLVKSENIKIALPTVRHSVFNDLPNQGNFSGSFNNESREGENKIPRHALFSERVK